MIRVLALLVVVAGCQEKIDEYTRRSKSTEAQILLMRLTRIAKVHADDGGAFPKGNAGPTPSVPCCKQPKAHCEPNPEDWKQETWAMLAFEVDQPHRFQYSYASDGTTFTVTATADLECNGEITTLQAGGKIVNGKPLVDDSQLRAPKS